MILDSSPITGSNILQLATTHNQDRIKMATTALAQEKVWVEKAVYDKAECQYFERLAKPAQCYQVTTNTGTGIWTNCDNLVAADTQNQIIPNPMLQAISKKSKKNKSPVTETTEILNTFEKKIEDGQNNEDPNEFKPKEAKEKKNKADKKHGNKKEPKKLIKEQKESDYTTNLSENKLKPVADNSMEGAQSSCSVVPARGTLANEIAKARRHIKQSLQCVNSIASIAGSPTQECVSRVAVLEKENQELQNIVAELKSVVAKLDERVKILEDRPWFDPMRIAICPPKPPSPVQAVEADDEKDDVDLFGSDSEGEDDAAAKLREERVAAYAAKKSKKPALIAKSNIILDVKPWDDETDMKAMEAEVRKIETDGLLWGAAKLVPLAYGIRKLQISCVVEDDKVSIDWLTEQIEANEDFVQSVDIAAFNKV
ncbi:probable elongation factor 1-delta isoform X1 [Athalia rosae]|uniref:probable elongation factor 1-delta isoform X1 n=2 Tax=Athalia rosae TaxID=37344 RepID=UPI0020343A44|nr:probable elongation factor 1-delta isoform X1 [Athalia rosae]